MLRKLSCTDRLLVFFTILLALSLFGMGAMESVYYPTVVMYVEQLNQKPTSYIALENPDPYFLQAVNNPPHHYAVMRTFDYTQIDELQHTQNTSNVKYKDNYFSVAFAFGDNFPPPLLPLLFLAGLIASPVAILIIGLVKIARFVRSRV